jgi:hypothetical protein
VDLSGMTIDDLTYVSIGLVVLALALLALAIALQMGRGS